MFYVYEDWTTEETPRCFYVGKGSLSRVNQMKRNAKHTWTSSVYGMDRRVVLATSAEQDTFTLEINLVGLRQTYYEDNSFGCNFTRGGEGASGLKRSQSNKDKLRIAKLGKPGHPQSPATRDKISNTMAGRPPNNNPAGSTLSAETRARMSAARKGKPKSEAWKRLMSERMKGNTNGKRKDVPIN